MQYFPADLTTHDVHFEPTVEILPSQTKGHDLAPLKTKYPSSTYYEYGSISFLSEKEIGSKNQFTPLFFPTNISLSSFSLPTASSTLENPTETFLLHQQMAAQLPYEPKSSPATEQPPRTPFSLLYKPFSSFPRDRLRPQFLAKTPDMIKILMSYPKCKSVEVINNPARPGSNHRKVNYIKL